MKNTDKEALLSICIPTYRRAPFLDEALEHIGRQLRELPDTGEVELLISDNCSPDNTPVVVEKHIAAGLPIRYVRNAENLGMDGNFVNCLRKATGKYVWILGDDDHLSEGSLAKILSILRENDFGWLNLDHTIDHYFNKARRIDGHLYRYDSAADMIRNAGHQITFISANIAKREFVEKIDFDSYMGSFFTIIPFYLKSALNSSQNGILKHKFIEGGKDQGTNGGYNFFGIFIVNYLSIMKDLIKDLPHPKKLYAALKKEMFYRHISPHITPLLIKKQKGNYDIEGGWKILFNYYGWHPYAYYKFIRVNVKNMVDKLRNR